MIVQCGSVSRGVCVATLRRGLLGLNANVQGLPWAFSCLLACQKQSVMFNMYISNPAVHTSMSRHGQPAAHYLQLRAMRKQPDGSNAHMT